MCCLLDVATCVFVCRVHVYCVVCCCVLLLAAVFDVGVCVVVCCRRELLVDPRSAIAVC